MASGCVVFSHAPLSAVFTMRLRCRKTQPIVQRFLNGVSLDSPWKMKHRSEETGILESVLYIYFTFVD